MAVGAALWDDLLEGEEVAHADIFIQIRPVYPLFFADKAPIISLFRRPMQQAGIPRERNGNSAAVIYVNSEGIIRYYNFLAFGFSR